MAIALVSAGAITTSATASVTPSFGQATTAGNLLVCCFGTVVSGGNTTFGVPSGWSIEPGTSGTNVPTAVYYKPNCSASETAPAFSTSGGGVYTASYAVLFEVSGADTSSPLDQSAIGSGIATPATKALSAADANTSDLVASALIWTNSKSTTYTVSVSVTPSGGTSLSALNTGGTKGLGCFGATIYAINGNGGSSADSVTWTVTPSQGALSGWSIADATFIPAPPPQPAPQPVQITSYGSMIRSKYW